MLSLTLRHADPQRDAAACASIYAPYVDGSAVSFEEVVLDATRFAERIETSTRTHPWLVLEHAGRAVAFAHAGPHRARAAYRWAAEVGVYVAPDHHRAGAGRRLYTALFGLLRRQGLYVACAGITLPNDPSVALHLAFGFLPVGVQHRIGFKAGAWRDVSWWQLDLRPEDGDDPPAEPLGPQRLRD